MPGPPEQKVKPGEIVPCEIAIWPSSTLFHASEKPAVDISGKCGVKDDLLRGFNSPVNKGRHSIYTGGRKVAEASAYCWVNRPNWSRALASRSRSRPI